jgi:hypothetical protein
MLFGCAKRAPIPIEKKQIPHPIRPGSELQFLIAVRIANGNIGGVFEQVML